MDSLEKIQGVICFTVSGATGCDEHCDSKKESCRSVQVGTEQILALLQPQQPADSSTPLTIKGELIENLCPYCVAWSKTQQVCIDMSILGTSACRQLIMLLGLCRAQYAHMIAQGWLSPEQAKQLRDELKAMQDIESSTYHELEKWKQS